MEIQRLNIQDISAACGFSYYNFRNWKAGIHKVPTLARQKMKEVYGLNPEWIIGRSREMYSDPAQQSQQPPARSQAAGGKRDLEQELPRGVISDLKKVIGKRKR
jgi:hypothetical protein